MKILLVEDSRAVRHENERALIKTGYEVVSVGDGVSALCAAQDQKPDLILLDLLLPNMSGTEVLRKLKGDPQTADIPVIILSALCGKNRDKLIEEGAEEYLEKSSLMPERGENLLPRILEDVICRINRKRGILFASTPTSH